MIGFSCVWFDGTFIKICSFHVCCSLSLNPFSFRLVCVFLALFTVQFLISRRFGCRDYKLLTLLHSIDPTNYLFTNWFSTFVLFFFVVVCCLFLDFCFQNRFTSVKFSSHREVSSAKIYHVKLIYRQLSQVTVQAPVSPLNHAGAQNAGSCSRLVVVVVVVMVAVHVVTVKTGMVATVMRCRRRLLSRVGV